MDMYVDLLWFNFCRILICRIWAGEPDYSPGDPSHPSTYCTTVLHLSKLSVSSLATKIEPITNIYNKRHKTFRHLGISTLVETFGISLYCEIPTISLQWAIKSEDDPFQCQCSDEEAFLSGHNKRILQGKLGNLSVSKVEGFILVFYKLWGRSCKTKETGHYKDRGGILKKHNWIWDKWLLLRW